MLITVTDQSLASSIGHNVTIVDECGDLIPLVQFVVQPGGRSENREGSRALILANTSLQ